MTSVLYRLLYQSLSLVTSHSRRQREHSASNGCPTHCSITEQLIMNMTVGMHNLCSFTLSLIVLSRAAVCYGVQCCLLMCATVWLTYTVTITQWRRERGRERVLERLHSFSLAMTESLSPRSTFQSQLLSCIFLKHLKMVSSQEAAWSLHCGSSNSSRWRS